MILVSCGRDCWLFTPDLVLFLLGSQLEISQLPLWLGVAIFSQWTLSRNPEDQPWPAVWTAAQEKNTSVSSFVYQHWRSGGNILSQMRKEMWVSSSSSLLFLCSLFNHSFISQQMLSVLLPHARLWRYRDSEPAATWGPPLLTSLCHYQWKVLWYHSFPLACLLPAIRAFEFQSAV